MILVEQPRLLLVAGPNGAGKTTVTERGLASSKHLCVTSGYNAHRRDVKVSYSFTSIYRVSMKQ